MAKVAVVVDVCGLAFRSIAVTAVRFDGLDQMRGKNRFAGTRYAVDP